MTEINWNVSKVDIELIKKITNRAVKMAQDNNRYLDPIDLSMDITACHCNGTPLDLKKLLKADDFNFAHDVFQIPKHINRKTGKLEGFFLPRCSCPQTHVDK